ncbi:hypothetical protein [Mucilaginibacter flavus]|uniref:hypothetical protein n=1 Tax=Mucilaginibacter flavus TaxID=931504 RepID=UPI0025B28608|nr:hypothetical protein [Mucilaginibacter flavus]MDN3582365.1 hypothetical protein [Mucilaginibacter flavus]
MDLALVARKPGENFDTYHATFHGSSIYLIGPLVYDQAKYPNLVNGVPGFGQSMYGDNYATVDYQNTGPDGNVFGGTQGTMSVTDLSAYHKDLESYFKAVDTQALSGNGPIPLIYDYVKQSYPTSSGGILFFTGKVIRVTTGTHIAFADINYPLPAATPYTIPSTFINVPDPNNSSIHYFLQGDKGTISNGHIAYLNGTVYTNGPAIAVSGSYTQVTVGAGDFHSIGTIIRQDNTTFRFDQVDNTN